MPTITFYGINIAAGGGNWITRFTCTDNRVVGRCKVRLVDASFYQSSPGSYSGYYRLDSLDGQMRNPLACDYYGGIIINPFDVPNISRESLQNDKSYEFETELQTNTIQLDLTPAIYAPGTPVSFATTNFDTGFIVFDVEPL